MKYLIILLLLLSAPVYAFDPWSKQDKILETTYLALHIVDWGQTIRIARQPEQYHEINPIIGEHPSEGRVHAFMALSGLLHIGITHVLPALYRPYWQGTTMVIKIGLVANNFSVGLGFGW